MSGLTLGAGYHITYGYDTNGRFETLAWNAAGQSGSGTYSYVPDANLLQGFATASGVQTTYGYEPQRNLKTRVQNRFDSTTISQYDYVYDPLGRRSSAANTGSAFAQAAFSRYGYNDRSELINAGRYLGADVNDTASPVTAEQRAYLYDPIGNRTRAEAAAAPVDYLTNELNQYTDIGGALPVYDDDGNMTATPDGRIYTYNAENRLIAAQPQTPAQGDTRTEYVYDYMGRRVQKVVSTYQSGSWNQDKEVLFVYNGWNMVKETTIASGQTAVDKYYVWGLDLSQSLQGAGGVGGLLAAVDGSLTYYYLFDANGNVGQMIDAADGSIAAHYEYDPYGNEVLATGSLAADNVYRFSTKYYDEEVNLYYYGYRHYICELGIWLNRDPVHETGGIKLYAFGQNNPTNFIDSLGKTSYLPFQEYIPPIAIDGVLIDGNFIVTDVEKAEQQYTNPFDIQRMAKQIIAKGCSAITSVYNNNSLSCACGAIGVLDNFNGALPIAKNAIEYADCGCNFLTSLNNLCSRGMFSYQFILQSLLTFADCNSSSIGSLAFSTTGATAGTAIEPVGGTLLGFALGQTAGDSIVDISLYAIQNMLNQESGNPLPIDASKSCCKIYKGYRNDIGNPVVDCLCEGLGVKIR